MKNHSYKNFTIYHHKIVDSTNSLAYKMAELGRICDREIIIADEQSAGRGRLQRQWISPIGNLYFSLVLQSQALKADIYQLSFISIVALRQAIEEIFEKNGFYIKNDQNHPKNPKNKQKNDKNRPKIENKWPNDLLIDGKKIAGLLLESKNNQQNCQFAIVGIGVNIVSNPQNTIFDASNLSEFGIKIDPQQLLYNFLDKFEILYQNWQNFGFAGIRNSWLSSAYRLNQQISIKIDQLQEEGIFETIDQNGNLVLKTADSRLLITVGDVC